MTVVKTFKSDLEGANSKTMKELFDDKAISYNNLEDNANVEKFINAVDVMLIVEKFAAQNIKQSKVEKVIKNHLSYNRLFCKLNLVKNNNANLNVYLDSIVNDSLGMIRNFEGRGDNTTATSTVGITDATAATASTPEQVVEDVKTYISEKKGLLQPAVNQENSQYAAIVSLMEQLEAEINRLNAPEADKQSNAVDLAVA